MKKISLLLPLLLLLPQAADAQYPVVLHSHNDYTRTAPFWEAYSQHCGSIEADVYLQDGEILVAHDRKDLSPDRNLREMYIEPIVKLFRSNGGRMWKDSPQRLLLVVDVKHPDALQPVVELVGAYPDVFDVPDGVRVVLSGNRPAPEHFTDYPSYIWFDGDFDAEGLLPYTPAQLEKVAMISTNFRRFAHKWNGKGRMIQTDLEAVKGAIEAVHAAGKPIRFWNSPEVTTSYFTFLNLGVDIINTDKPAVAARFFSDWSDKNYTPARRIPTYTPTYRHDGSGRKIRNVILLIGDGMGLNQIAAGAYANGRDLSILKMKSTGIQFYNPQDDFIGDSASGGSALATGEPSWTRHIASNYDGTQEIPPLTDYFHATGRATGVVTMGDIADATPAVFYAHTSERDSTELITSYMLSSDVDLICGSGRDHFEKPRKDGLDMIAGTAANGYTYMNDALALDGTEGKVICLDDRMGGYATDETLDFLASATRGALAKLQGSSRKGFFLMVEGAKIDYAGHAECFPASVTEQLAFDLAVAEALRFADADGHTLVVVTADHETGGLTLLDGDLESGRILAVYNSNDHTPTVVPVFAYGPGSRSFSGTYINTEIARSIKQLVRK